MPRSVFMSIFGCAKSNEVLELAVPPGSGLPMVTPLVRLGRSRYSCRVLPLFSGVPTTAKYTLVAVLAAYSRSKPQLPKPMLDTCAGLKVPSSTYLPVAAVPISAASTRPSTKTWACAAGVAAATSPASSAARRQLRLAPFHSAAHGRCFKRTCSNIENCKKGKRK